MKRQLNGGSPPSGKDEIELLSRNQVSSFTKRRSLKTGEVSVSSTQLSSMTLDLSRSQSGKRRVKSNFNSKNFDGRTVKLQLSGGSRQVTRKEEGQEKTHHFAEAVELSIISAK